VDGFDISLGVFTSRWDVAVGGGEQFFDGVGESAVGFQGGVTVEFGAVVALDDDVTEIDAVELKVLEKA